MKRIERDRWAAAIALRISDEWEGALSFPEDAELLRSFLEKALRADVVAIKLLIGTGIIENDFFENN
ncbi:MAG: hypothetical protein ACXW1C_03065 [Gallionella sp.]